MRHTVHGNNLEAKGLKEAKGNYYLVTSHALSLSLDTTQLRSIVASTSFGT
jgi:hypothetical protein